MHIFNFTELHHPYISLLATITGKSMPARTSSPESSKRYHRDREDEVDYHRSGRERDRRERERERDRDRDRRNRDRYRRRSR